MPENTDMTETETNPNFGTEINALTKLSAVMEANPWIPWPVFNTGSSASYGTTIKIHMWTPLPEAWDEDEKEAMKKSLRLIRKAFGGGTWKKNDPNQDSYEDIYYRQFREWNGVTLEILTYRSRVCTLVTHEEDVTELVPDPDVVVPMVPVMTTKVTREWKCSE